jgi:DNA invertase Pin-like site-specific DNA recombinase
LLDWRAHQGIDVQTWFAMNDKKHLKKDNMKKFVAYYRTSTHRQNLSIEAQRSMVENFVKSVGGTLVHEEEEKESGKNDERNGLELAIQYCEKYDCTLIISKLDRLSRSVSFLFQLRDRVAKNNIEIKALDMPSFSTLSLGIFATMAQAEREAISSRTKLALAELKKSGVVLGKPENFTHEHRLKGAEAMKEKALKNKNNQYATALIVEYREKGMSYDKIAEKLNNLNFFTSQGKKHNSTSIHRLFKRFLKLENEKI